jgi:hypothetical protein
MGNLKQRIGLIFIFYRRFIVMALLSTLLIIWFMNNMSFAWGIYAKFGVLSGFIAITHFTYAREYCYYRNRGVRPFMLWTGSLVMDMLIFILILTFAKIFLL